MHMMRVRILLIVRGKIRYESDKGLDTRCEILSGQRDAVIEVLPPNSFNCEVSEILA